MRPPERLVALGAVGRPHGLRGELRVHRFNPSSTLLLELPSVWVRQGDSVRDVRIEGARVHGEVVLLTLDGVRGREAAEALRGAELCVPREALPAPGAEEVYHADLLGLRAELTDGAAVGEIAEVITYPSADCLLLRGPEHDLEVPLLEPYVVEVDLPGRRVVVAHLEDLEPIRRKW